MTHGTCVASPQPHPSDRQYLPHEEVVQGLPIERRVLFSSGGLGSGAFNGFFNTALPLFLGHYQIPFWLLGLIAQERSVVGSILEPVVGAISDRTRTRLGRRRPFIMLGIPLAIVSMLILAQVPPLGVTVALLLVAPFFLAIANVPYRAMLADVAPPGQRGGLGGLMALTEMIGQVGVVVLAMLIWTANEQLVFYAVAAALAVGFGLVVLSTKEPPLGPPPPRARLGDPRPYLRDLLAFRPALLLVASQFAFWFGVGGVTPFLTRYAVDELGFDEPTAFGLFLLLIGFTALFSVPAGFAGDRLGKKRVLMVGLLVFAIAAAAGSRANTLVELGLVLAIIGFANAITTSLGFAFLTEMLPRRRMGELTGLSGMTWSLAQPLGSATAGLLADSTGTLRSVLLFAAVALLVSFVIMAAVKSPRSG